MLASSLARRASARAATRLVRATATGVLLAALFTLVSLALAGPRTATWLAWEGAGLSFRIDALATTVFLVIAFVGVLVSRYSARYLEGDARQHIFMGDLALTLAAAIGMTTAGNLLQLVVGWSAMSLSLHRLLLFRGGRPRARVAARKKFIVARLGDAALAGAALLLWLGWGTADLAVLAESARGLGGATPDAALHTATALIVLAALLKSAQFPTHGWLAEVMETPTPVSALLHAGIVNAGGFLVFRFADVMVLSPGALMLLVAVGAFTAVVGAVAMTTQTSVKVSLGYSTVAQMGFMLMQCGFGAFASAALHLVAHALYKAHAFLNSGTAVAQTHTVRNVANDRSPSFGALVLALTLALGTYLGIGAAFGHPATNPLAVQTLGALFVMGLFVFLARGAGSWATLWRVVPGAAVASLLYFSLQIGAATLYAGQVPAVPEPGLVAQGLAALTLITFAAVTLLQVTPADSRSRWRQAAYIHARNGLYANALFNRLTGALRRDVA